MVKQKKKAKDIKKVFKQQGSASFKVLNKLKDEFKRTPKDIIKMIYEENDSDYAST